MFNNLSCCYSNGAQPQMQSNSRSGSHSMLPPSGSSYNYNSSGRDIQQSGHGNGMAPKHSEGGYGAGPSFQNALQHKGMVGVCEQLCFRFPITNANNNASIDPNSTHSNFYKNEHGTSSSGKLTSSRPASGTAGVGSSRPVSANLQASLQALMQGTMPQQQLAGAASESSLRKKFSQLATGGAVPAKTTNYSKKQEQNAASFAKVGYYDHYGTFHKAAKKIRPVSAYVSLNPPPNPQNLSMVDRVLALNGAKDDSDPNQRPSSGSAAPKRAVSAGRVRPSSSTGASGGKGNGNSDVSKRLEEMYSNSVIGKLDAVMKATG